MLQPIANSLHFTLNHCSVLLIGAIGKENESAFTREGEEIGKREAGRKRETERDRKVR